MAMTPERFVTRLSANDPRVRAGQVVISFTETGQIRGSSISGAILRKDDPDDPAEQGAWTPLPPYPLPVPADLPAGSPIRQVMRYIESSALRTVTQRETELAAARAEISRLTAEWDKSKAALAIAATERDQARNDVGAVTAERDSAKAALATAIEERDQARNALTAAKEAAAVADAETPPTT